MLMYRGKKMMEILRLACFALPLVALTACGDPDNDNVPVNEEAIFLIIDEESIDNGNAPNDFSETDVNDQLARVGLREPLRYFRENAGRDITLYTGQVGDEGWFALRVAPGSWRDAGPTAWGLNNYLTPGPGLGAGDDDREVLLDEIPNVVPLRATGFAMLRNRTIFALVYDGDVSVNYSPLRANLQGANLGVVALQVLEVTRRTDGSSSSLPKVKVRILNPIDTGQLPLLLFSNPPIPASSSEPFDIDPPGSVPVIALEPAN